MNRRYNVINFLEFFNFISREFIMRKSVKPKIKDIAIIDLGSNSFHMVIARKIGGAVYILETLRYPVHLAAGLDNNGWLSNEAIERGLKCLTMFSERLQGMPPADVYVVGTFVLRTAVNIEDFVTKVADIMPYPIHILSGHDEAKLIFKGVSYLRQPDDPMLVVDIGGGSTEIIIGENFIPEITASCAMGCVSFAGYFPENCINKENFYSARDSARRKIKVQMDNKEGQGWTQILGTSGTIKTISKVIMFREEIPEGLITREHLESLVEDVLLFPDFKSLALPGLSKERRATFVPGLAVLCGVFDALKLQEMTFIKGGLREGALYDMVNTYRSKRVRLSAFKRLARQYSLDIAHAQRVRKTARFLCQQWCEQKNAVQTRLSALLEWSAMLHEVGLLLDYSNVHRHSSYIINNTEIFGFDRTDRSIISAFVGCHIKSIKFDDIPYVPPYRNDQLLPFLLMLRLSVVLNSDRQPATRLAPLLYVQDMHWKLKFTGNTLMNFSLIASKLEKEKSYWKKLGWKLSIMDEQ